MDGYQRVEKPKGETSIKENEIRITTQDRMPNYITYATTFLQRRMAGLHQNTAVGSTHITDMWEPLAEGLPLETTRHVSDHNCFVNKGAGYILHWEITMGQGLLWRWL
ncbi:hypothetical protein Ancab_002963 [Ancistrocladus abbreviatus]